VPIRRRLCLAVLIAMGAGVVAVMLTARPTFAQTQETNEAPSAATQPSLLRPQPDGPRSRAQRFERRKPTDTEVAPSRIGKPLTFGNPPGAGAGTTGFNSTNVAKPKTKAGTEGRQATDATKASKTAKTADSQKLPVPTPATTRREDLTGTFARAPRGSERRRIPAAGDTPETNESRVNALRRRRAEEDRTAFDPVGVRVGAFVLRPAIEVTAGYDSNPSRSTNGKGSTVLVVAPELNIKSDWLRHELTANIASSYTAYGSHEASVYERPYMNAKVNSRIDASERTHINLEGRFLLSTDNPGSPDLQADIARLPFYTTVGGTAGISQQFNRFEVAINGTIDSTKYANSKLTNGTTASNADRNFNQYGGNLRGSYELTPGVKPFIEIGGDTRIHQLTPTDGGPGRDSDGRYIKVGSTFEVTRKLTGQIDIGYLQRSYRDPSLPQISGLIYDSSLIWTASALTKVKLTATSVVNESTLAGVSGQFTRTVGLEFEHAFRRYLIGGLKFSYGTVDYVGSPRIDTTFSTSATLIYKLTRTVQFKGEIRREWLHSTEPGNNYFANVVMFGIRLQR